jgi:hypothetical protein
VIFDQAALLRKKHFLLKLGLRFGEEGGKNKLINEDYYPQFELLSHMGFISPPVSLEVESIHFLPGNCFLILWIGEIIKMFAFLFCRGNMVDAFRTHIMQTKELGTCPVRQIGGCSFLYMRISNVYIVIVVSSNANAACAFKFVVEVCIFEISCPRLFVS